MIEITESEAILICTILNRLKHQADALDQLTIDGFLKAVIPQMKKEVELANFLELIERLALTPK